MQIPHKFEPRPYQIPFFNSIHDGYKRGVGVWHRRAGKDKTIINLLVKESYKRKGLYYYLFPTYKQAKKAIWFGMDRSGFKFLDHIPKEIRVRTNETDMLIELDNGSIIQIVGSDNYDSLMGSNPVGCVFSEYSLQDPRAWEFIKPILRENGGWALFIYTPRGHNHGYKLFKMALVNDAWFCEKLTITDTGVLTDADMDAERAEGTTGDMIEQEYFCSFEAAMPGAYYAKEMAMATKEKRITGVPYDAAFPVNTYWDIGYSDSTAIWFAQDAGREIHLIDYAEEHGEGLAFYKKLLDDRGYTYGKHYAPHDIKKHEFGPGKSIWKQAGEIGIKFQVKKPWPTIEDGIQACRSILSKCWFDAVKCDRGLDALKSYRKDYDETKRVYTVAPVHDWASHGADAFRTLGVFHQFAVVKEDMKDLDYGDPENYAGYFPGGL